MIVGGVRGGWGWCAVWGGGGQGLRGVGEFFMEELV